MLAKPHIYLEVVFQLLAKSAKSELHRRTPRILWISSGKSENQATASINLQYITQ